MVHLFACNIGTAYLNIFGIKTYNPLIKQVGNNYERMSQNTEITF